MKSIKILVLPIVLFIFNSCITSRSYLESRYISISENVLPSVVEIISVGIEDEGDTKWFDFFQDQEDFLKDDINTGVGSGVIAYREDNYYYIMTNRHVVGNLEKVSVLLYNDILLIGDVIGSDDRFDIAVVKIYSEEPLKAARISERNRLKVGQFVAALGSPMSYVQSISMGIISNIGRFGGPKGNLSNYIQTDAAINHGNSGGPLVNMKGEVIGINTWISSPTSGNIGLGFAMPIENIYPSFMDIVKNGAVEVGWVGVSSYGLPNSEYYLDKKGAFINQVVIDSPAYQLGIKAGDIVYTINDKRILTSDELFLNISLLKPGELARIKLLRGSDFLSMALTLGVRADSVLETSRNVFPGFVLLDEEGVIKILQVLPKSVGLSSGFIKNDIIRSVNGNNLDKIEDFYSFLTEGVNNLVIYREDQELELQLVY